MDESEFRNKTVVHSAHVMIADGPTRELKVTKGVHNKTVSLTDTLEALKDARALLKRCRDSLTALSVEICFITDVAPKAEITPDIRAALHDAGTLIGELVGI